jgi:hypothetical protein
MSDMDNNCLFYRITEKETAFIVLFVDDTLKFSKRQQDIDQFVVKMNNYYELTLDTKADSFLGINISHNDRRRNGHTDPAEATTEAVQGASETTH